MAKDTAIHQAFKSASSGNLKDLCGTKFRTEEKSFKKTIEENIGTVENGQYEVLGGYSEVQALKEYKDCSIRDTRFVLFNFNDAFALPKGSSFKQLFNHILMKMIETIFIDDF